MQPDSIWTDGVRPELPDEGLHETFARRALDHPDAPAVVSGDRVLTYGELNRLADGWAARLTEFGVTRGEYVPILVPRSVDLVVAVLGVLKAGCVYVLLDPAWPAAYLTEIVDQLDAPFLVARPTGAVPDPRRWWPQPGPAPVDFRAAKARSADPCCVFFTSGTTGPPKGVVSPHRATARLFQPDTFARFGRDTVVPLAAPTPWDAFSLELWSVLLTGGTSVIVPEPYLSAAFLRQGIPRFGIDTIWLTASVFNLIVDEDPSAFAGLRQVMVGGERLSGAHVARFLRQHGQIALLNGYGPVESTVFATTHRITGRDCDRPGGIPIGRPVAGTDVFVLDASRQCAVGEVGEICLAGDGLALGYLGDPALTAARFVQVDLGRSEPRLVYRTGDLGVWGPDGLLEFQGRFDRQVKIRGHRVEPAEIERRIEDLLAGVRQCRIVVGPDDAGGHRMVAFCVPTLPGDDLAGASDVLATELAAHQRPVAVIGVDAFPLTKQGKLDERALIAAASTVTVSDRPPAPVEGGDDLVRLVADTFASVLNRPHVPLDVSFFELGGGSLAAGRVCARLGRRIGRPVRLSVLYEAATVTAFADWLRSAAPDPSVRSTVVEPDRAPGAAGSAGVPLTPTQLMLLTRHVAHPGDRTGHCLLFWRIDGDLDVAALEAAIATVHQRHESLRAAYVLDPTPCARLVDIAPPALEVLSERSSVEAAVRALRAILGEELAPLDGDVWRAALVPVAGSATAVFGCVVHHVAFDGWSEAVLAGDLGSAYRGGPGALDHPAPLLGAAAQQQATSHVDIEAQIEASAGDLRDIPAMHWPSGPQWTAEGPGEVTASLSPAAMVAVDAVAAKAGVTRFVVQLAAWAHAVATVTGRRDFAVGVPVAQRSTPELEHAVGCHLTMLCLRLRGAAVAGGSKGVEATRRVVRRGLARLDVPLQALVERFGGDSRGWRPPLFQVLFALQDNAAPRLELPGARTKFLRQSYLDIPLELHGEVWPTDDGGAQVQVSFRREVVPEATARELLRCFMALADPHAL